MPSGVFVSASDYLKVLPDSIDKWLPKKLQALGTDGFGRSDSREALRNFFEVDSRFIVLATLYALMQEKQVGEIGVVDADGRLVGYVSRENLAELMMIENAGSRPATSGRAAPASGGPWS